MITQEQLAKKLDVKPSYLSKLLAGEIWASRTMARKLEDITQISRFIFLDGHSTQIISCLEDKYGAINMGRGRCKKK